ncbi:nuclear transport factor 2 family protein [Lacibacterium aquatile]|uniref:Nuclear transport factor 2 family protein n=1 Tax=Lacibacterium aquatile TaxID=1168082 RepID=A0ABW5E240_9PROT
MTLSDLARAYLASIETDDQEAVFAFYHPDVVQEEYPNRLLAVGARRDFGELRQAAQQGAALMAEQRYEINHLYECGQTVIIECSWTGRLAQVVPGLPADRSMRARFAVVLEYRDKLIWRQRNYDCFEAW